jgi:hypothetical protein
MAASLATSPLQEFGVQGTDIVEAHSRLPEVTDP